MDINKLKKRLKKREIILMDGAIGTEISRRGYVTALPLWSAGALLTNPQVVKEIHKDHIRAGAEIIITNTFRTTERSLLKKNIKGRSAELTLLACNLAKQAIKEAESKHDVFIAGSVAPLEDCYRPELTPPDKELEKEHFEYVRNLKDGGVDFILFETMITKKELLYGLKAAEKLNLLIAVSFCCNEKMQLLSGEKLSDVILEIEKYEPLFIGINCVSRKIAENAVAYLHSITKLPICVYAQGDGEPNPDQGWKFNEVKSVDAYLKSARKWLRNGAIIIGGCCGTTPLHIYKLKQLIKPSI